MSPARRQRGSGGLYRTKDLQGRPDLWRAAVDLGFTPAGTRRRKVVSSKSRNEVIRKLAQLRRTIEDTGSAPAANITVGRWLTDWLDGVAAARVRPRTLATYRGYVDRYLVPHLGRRRLDQLQPQHVRAMHKAMTDAGLSSTTALQAHRILVKALSDAHREGLLVRNVAQLVDAPRRATASRGALTPEQAVTLLRSVDQTAMGARWAAALFLGARQGEALGLAWDRVDLDAGTVDLAWQLQRLPYRHGCDGTCGRSRAGSCPRRELAVPVSFEHRVVDGGLVLTRPKSRAGLRVIPLPGPMLRALRWHRERSTGDGLVWTRPDGRPIDPKDDSAAWRQALATAGLPPVPLHAARHTTATLLGRLGVGERVVSSILGHNSLAVTQGYIHSDLTMQRDAMDRLGGLLALD